MFAGFIFCQNARDAIIWGSRPQFIGTLEFWQPLMDIEDTHRPLSEHFSPQFNSTLFHRVIELLLNLLEPRFWDCSRYHSCSLTSNSLSQKPRTKAKLSIPFQVLRHDGVFLWYFHREFLVSLNCFSFSWDYPVHTHCSLSDTLTQLGREEEGQTDGPRSSLSLLVVSFWFSVWKWL